MHCVENKFFKSEHTNAFILHSDPVPFNVLFLVCLKFVPKRDRHLLCFMLLSVLSSSLVFFLQLIKPDFSFLMNEVVQIFSK